MTAIITRTADLSSDNGTSSVKGSQLTHTELDQNFYPILLTTDGTVEASRAIVVDANKDFTGLRNLTMTGDLNITGTVTAGVIDVTSDYVCLQWQETSGTAGSAISATTWTKITLNTEVNDDGAHCTVTSSVINLSTGDWRMNGVYILNDNGGTGYYKTRLRNTTGGTTAVVGSNGGSGNLTGGFIQRCAGKFTVSSASDDYEFQAYSTRATDAQGAVSSGEVEVYAQLELWKVG